MFFDFPLSSLDFFCKTTIIFSHDEIIYEIFIKKFLPLNFQKRKTFFVCVRKKFSKKFIFNRVCPTKHVVNTAIPRIISESNHAETTCRCLCMVGKDGMQMTLYATNHWLVRYKQMVYSIQSYCLHHLKLSFASSKAMVYAF